MTWGGKKNRNVLIWTSGSDVVLRYFYFSSGGHPVQQSGMVYSLSVEGIIRKISVKQYFEFWLVVKEEMAFKDISFFSNGIHFVQRGKVCAILLEGL